MNGKNPNLVLWILPLIILLILVLLPFLLTRPTWWDQFDYTGTGQIGDTIGGIAGPAIALLAAVLTFFAFWIQFKANIAHTEQFEKQDNDTKIDRFENKFYQLVRLHRENVSEISIIGKSQITGRKAFISLYIELRFCYLLLEHMYNVLRDGKRCNQELSDFDLLNISYITFFYGVGDSSDKLYFEYLKNFDETLIYEYNDHLKKISEKWSDKDLEINSVRLNKQIMKHRFQYKPFSGHMSRLSHYYRHLYQSTSFVVEQEAITNKIEYLKTLRAQLSSHEQLLLYYNSLTILGGNWLSKGYLTDYLMIKNMPVPLADFGPRPIEVFKKKYNKDGENILEWFSLGDSLKPSDKRDNS